MTVAGHKSDFQLTTDTPYLALKGELWDGYCEAFGEIWQRFKSHCIWSLCEKKTVSVLSAHGGLIALSFEVFITVQYIYVTRSRDHKNPNELYNHNMVVFKTHRDLRKWPTFCRRHFQKHFFLNIFFLLLIQIPLRFVHMAPIGNN